MRVFSFIRGYVSFLALLKKLSKNTFKLYHLFLSHDKTHVFHEVLSVLSMMENFNDIASISFEIN